MDIVVFKSIAFVAVLLTGIFGGWISLVFAKGRDGGRLLGWGNAFSGGIFLGAGLIHLLPDALEDFASFAGGTDYPCMYVTAACGYLLVLLLGKVAVRVHESEALAESSQGKGGVYPYLLTLVLSVHSLIAGTALGVEDTLSLALVILLAVVAHKGSAAFALGVGLQRGGVARGRMMGLLGLFCVMTPIGIVIGSILTTALTATATVAAESVFGALAAGTFIYVAAGHVIAEEFEEPEGRDAKFVFVTLGVAVMALLAVWL